MEDRYDIRFQELSNVLFYGTTLSEFCINSPSFRGSFVPWSQTFEINPQFKLQADYPKVKKIAEFKAQKCQTLPVIIATDKNNLSDSFRYNPDYSTKDKYVTDSVIDMTKSSLALVYNPQLILEKEEKVLCNIMMPQEEKDTHFQEMLSNLLNRYGRRSYMEEVKEQLFNPSHVNILYWK